MESSTEINQAAAALARGELVAFPTETVYGLGADATSDAAVAAVFAAKRRPSFNPLISHVASIEQALQLGQFPPAAERLGRAFWPGPLTIVVPRAPQCPVSLLASAGLGSIALRVPAHPVALALLAAFGKPVVAPSANPSGRLSPTTAEHVRKGLGSRVAMVLDGGASAVGLESTVVSFMADRPALLRAGGLERPAIEEVLGQRLAETEEGPAHAPGQLASHYAPRAALRLAAKRPGEGEAYLGFGLYSHGPYNLSPRGDLTEAAANLFRMLHEIDAAGAEAIAVAPIPATGLGEAINDRLKRAAAPRYHDA
jgi:L-threonylcarbamoyladenylate synthase